MSQSAFSVGRLNDYYAYPKPDERHVGHPVELGVYMYNLVVS